MKNLFFVFFILINILFLSELIRAEVKGVVINQANVTGVVITPLSPTVSTSSGEPNWQGNETNMLVDCPAGNYTYGIFINGTWKCRSDQQGTGGGDVYQGYYNSSLINATELEHQSGGLLGIKLSWLTSWIDSWFGTKTTDDLTQGTTNLYQNQSWNETRANNLYIEEGTKIGNTTNEIFGVSDNGTYIKTGGAGTSYPTILNLTSVKYDGNISNNTHAGYIIANKICSTNFTGSHFCNEFEITSWFAHATNPIINNNDTWIIAGSPKYIPATVPVNDCNGWTYEGTVTYLGNYWHIDNSTGGDGRALNCGTLLPISCCSN